MKTHRNDEDKKVLPEEAQNPPKQAEDKEAVHAEIEGIIDQSREKVAGWLDQYGTGSMGIEEGGGSMGFQMERDFALQKEYAINRLTKIGPARPIGFLPLTELSYFNIDNHKLIDECRANGLETRIFQGKGWPGWQEGALYVYDKSSLQKMLDENKKILEDAKWPLEADQFVRNLNVKTETGSPMDKLLDRIFGEGNREDMIF